MLTIDPMPMARTCSGRKVAEADDRAPRKFTQLQAFEAAVRRGSFSAARTELGGSNVSRHVADLENRLGRKLLLRSPRGALTREGQVLFGYLTRSAEQIRRLMGVIEAGSLERQSIHRLLHGAHLHPSIPRPSTSDDSRRDAPVDNKRVAACRKGLAIRCVPWAVGSGEIGSALVSNATKCAGGRSGSGRSRSRPRRDSAQLTQGQGYAAELRRRCTAC